MKNIAGGYVGGYGYSGGYDGHFPYDSIGDCTAHCLSDAYTDEGWFSVALGIATAATGYGGAAVAAAYCAAACLDCKMFKRC